MKLSTNATLPTLALVILIASSLTACSKTVAVGDGATATIDANGSKVEVNGKNGQTVKMAMDGSATYPSSMPCPQYPGSKVTMSVDSGNAPGQSSKSVNLTTGDTIEKCAAFYKDWFNSNGWKIEAESTMSGMASVVGKKDDLTCTIMAMGTNKGENILTMTLASSK